LVGDTHHRVYRNDSKNGAFARQNGRRSGVFAAKPVKTPIAIFIFHFVVLYDMYE
jgi:hypothetical protein